MSQTDTSPRGASRKQLKAEHADLDEIFNTLTACSACGDWREVNERWEAFAQKLSEHMDFEERHLFPRFAASSAAHERETNRLRLEHGELRNLLQDLGISIQTHHGFALSEVEALIAKLRAHAKREDELFYPWLDTADTHVTRA